MRPTAIHIDALDHVVLTVESIERTLDWYAAVLGMEARVFGDGRVALHFGSQKFNLHEVGTVLDANVRHATPGAADLCLLTATPLDVVLEVLSHHGVPVVEGPVRRTGANGPLDSVYVYDPDENLIEIANPV